MFLIERGVGRDVLLSRGKGEILRWERKGGFCVRCLDGVALVFGI